MKLILIHMDKSKNAARCHLEQSMKKLNTKSEHRTRLESTWKFANIGRGLAEINLSALSERKFFFKSKNTEIRKLHTKSQHRTRLENTWKFTYIVTGPVEIKD